MENKKKNLTGFFRAFIFLIIFVFLFIEASNILMPKVKDDANGKPVNMISSVRALDDNTIDVVFFGSSNAYCSINPIKIWLDTGITSCVISTPFLTESEVYYRAKDILKTQSPEYFILETDCMFETGNEFDENGYIISSAAEQQDRLGIAEIKSRLNDFESSIMAAISSKYPIMKYNFRWKKIDFSELKEATREKAFTSKGYRPSKAVKPFEYGSTYMAFSDNSKEELSDLSLRYFYKLLDLCRDNNIKLALLTVPSGSYWNMAKHRSIVELAELNGIDYVDFNYSTELIPEFDWQTDTKDAGNHLNNSGARKITAAYEKILTDRYSLSESTLTDEQLEKWNNDAQIFCEKNFGKSISPRKQKVSN